MALPEPLPTTYPSPAHVSLMPKWFRRGLPRAGRDIRTTLPPIQSPGPALSLPQGMTAYGALAALPPRDAAASAQVSAVAFPPFYGNSIRSSPEERRWRVDGWVLWREGSGSVASPATSRLSGYGGSQAGAIGRYRLGAGGSRDPFLFLRASRSLVADGETEAGLGFGLRPVPKLPVSLQGELRLTDRRTGTSLRPAVFAVTEIPPLSLAPQLEAEVYLQGGYVGGEFGTAFADGQARIERRMTELAGADLSFGGGVWGGAQEGAARLDVGPTASLRFDIGDVPVRLSLDYRARVAGDADPGSGVAVTIVSGF